MQTSDFGKAVVEARKLTPFGDNSLMCAVRDIPGVDKLPIALVILLENVIRRARTDEEAQLYAKRILDAATSGSTGDEIEFMPARVLFQDFTGVPVFCDFAAMRDAVVERGGDPSLVNPRIPCTLVIDHSVSADCVGSDQAACRNADIEIERNRERFSFLKWSSASFDNVEIVPPGQGICHQLNIERFAKVVMNDALATQDSEVMCFDTLVGTDSHTPTANGIGVLGWGVGGIEAEAAALGQPISMRVPEVIGLHLTGKLASGVSAMDLALTVAQALRAEGVVGCLVEAYGEGVSTLTVTQRACVSNMTPEYGATSTLFPIDDNVLSYLTLTGRDDAHVAAVRDYAQAQGVWEGGSQRTYSRVVELDLSCVQISLAGPSRPHDRCTPATLRDRVRTSAADHGHGDFEQPFPCETSEGTCELHHGALAIAAITSCTTATDPAMMLAAGLTARAAAERGLMPKPWVKRILAPGSHATELLLRRAGLMDGLNACGFYTCGFGCMSCIGNSGPVLDCIKPLAASAELTSVLSGNRNFDGRISPDVSQNYLCQPALVVAYSLVGTMDVDLSSEPVGLDAQGNPVMLTDILPTSQQIEEALAAALNDQVFSEGMAGLLEGDASWKAIESSEGSTYAWDDASTYVRRPPYFDIARSAQERGATGARALVRLGDFVTTDHISPAGAISSTSPAARYLTEHGVAEADFNTYGSRRGNHEVMACGTFANVKLANKLADGKVGNYTRDLLTGQITSVYDAAVHYMDQDVPLVIVAGKMYGSGSSRDWAAKGPLLQGVTVVMAESLERIHRSNLVQMGILPLEFADGVTADSLGLTGEETYDVEPVVLTGDFTAGQRTHVRATATDGHVVEFDCVVRIDTPTEAAYMVAGGILPFVLEQMMA